MSHLRIFDDIDTARTTILKRVPLDEFELSPRLQAGIERIFGESLTAEAAVTRILRDIRERGDAALFGWMRRIDGVELDDSRVRVSEAEIRAAYDAVDAELVTALRTAAERIEAFHRQQPLTSWLTTNLGGTLGQIVTPIERVGVYAPAGTAPLPSSLLMAAIPAKVAGVPDVMVCSPPSDPSGAVNPLTLVAADVAGVRAVYRVGGAQAVGAMAYGTASLPRVDKIVGPGNIFVVLAKRAVYGMVGVDGIPGPTETLVIADGSANPAWVAADLLAQAEHDTLASAILLTPDRTLAAAVQAEVERQLVNLSRADIITESLSRNGGVVLVADLHEAVAVANDYAAEHLCLLVENPWAYVPQIKHAGGIFLGEHSFEVLGDYVAGPSHIMPTGATARFASPVNVLDFVKLTSVVSLNPADAADLSRAAARIADSEHLTAHAAAARHRID